MRHRKAGLKLNRTSSHRNAMFRNMVTSLFKYEKIRTTDVKAKELRRWADNLITLAKRGDLHARRHVLAIVMEKDVVRKLFESAAQRYGSTSGGYTRITKLGRRRGDAAPISMIELIVSDTDIKKKKKKPKVAAEKKPLLEEKAVAAETQKEEDQAKIAEASEKAEEKAAALEPAAASKEVAEAEKKAEGPTALPVEPQEAKAEEPPIEKSDTESKA